MPFIDVLALALGLAMDAMAVAAARGLMAPRLRASDVLRVALLFGAFQALFPLAGWLVGERVGSLVAEWDHWLVFGVLSAMGAKLLVEAKRAKLPDVDPHEAPFALGPLLVLGVATSLDALAAGLTLPLLNAPLALSLATIGVVTAVLSGLGVVAGRRFGAHLGRRLDAFGGVMLIALGTKTLVEHLTGRA